jgi:glycosyltransferase involved in cell wall biosynthesis/SAM-dependent methyltransferase
MLKFTGERIVPEADNCEPLFARKMYQEHLARYLFASQICRGKRVLDVGCGVGYGAHLLASRGAAQVTAFDISEAAVQHALEYYSHPKIEYLVASAEDFSISGRYDVVTCFELIEHLDHQHRAVERIGRALAEDGLLIMSTPRPIGEKRSAFHTRELQLSDFTGLLGTYFEYIQLFFENNHFASLVTSEQPAVLDAIHPLHPQFSLGQADYFVAVASRSQVDAQQFRPQLVLNDERYVKNLERDVDILHRAEADFQARISVLTDENSNLRVRLDASEAEVRALIDGSANLRAQVQTNETGIQALAEENTKLRVRLEASEAQVESLAKENANLRVRTETVEAEHRAQISRLSEEHSILRQQWEASEEVRQSRLEQLANENTDLRTRSQALGREILATRAATATVRQEFNAMDARRSSLQQEVVFWRQSAADQQVLVDSLRGNINALYLSASWRITAPLRSGLDMLLAARQWWNGKRRWWNVKRRPVKELPPARKEVATSEQPPAPIHESSKTERACEFLGQRSFDVIYVIACHEGESKRYRAHNLAEGLNELGYMAAAIPDNEAAALIESGVPVKTLVLFRSGDTQSARDLMTYCRERGIAIVFDVDDLIFEPECVGFVRVVNGFSAPERAEYLRGVEQYRKLLLAADYVTCPTRFLAERIEQLGSRAAVIPNSLNRRQIEIAHRLRVREKTNSAAVRVGYFSGSNTHQVDFEACEGALLSLMERRSDFRFVAAGILDLGPRWDHYQDRIERHPYMPYEKMLEVLASIDVNLAPLEVGNPYCEGKSQLKIFEAGLVGVPTIASPTASYREAINHGADGFLAGNRLEWLDCLERLIVEPELRSRLGENARQRALRQFGLETVAAIAAKAYGLAEAPAAPHSASQLKTSSLRRPIKISWIIPGLIIGGGGHRNILRAAYYLERFGHEVELYFTSTDLTERQLSEAIRTHFYPLNCRIHCYRGSIGPTDVLFATHWSTVDAAVRAKDAAGELMYFVQDFEPAFAAMGTEYVLAENTYRLGLYHITSGPWCEHVLKREFRCDADHFLFPVDRGIYYPRSRVKRERNLIFFAKPEMPRRCFELGAMALEEFHRLRPDVEIILFGSKHVEGKRLSFPATIHSLLPTIEDLAALYSNADIGIVFSTTNPSLVPYEMMACGVPVVDLGRPGNEINYNGRHDIALLADPAPATMARQIRELLENPEELGARSRAGLEFVGQFPSEEQMARRVEGLILRRLEAKGYRSEWSGATARS